MEQWNEMKWYLGYSQTEYYGPSLFVRNRSCLLIQDIWAFYCYQLLPGIQKKIPKIFKNRSVIFDIFPNDFKIFSDVTAIVLFSCTTVKPSTPQQYKININYNWFGHKNDIAHLPTHPNHPNNLILSVHRSLKEYQIK